MKPRQPTKRRSPRQLTIATDTETAVVNDFKREGAFLLLAELEAARLEKLAGDSDEAVLITVTELARLARMFSRAVAIAKDYHLGAAETI